jgi:hypothetical protein
VNQCAVLALYCLADPGLIDAPNTSEFRSRAEYASWPTSSDKAAEPTPGSSTSAREEGAGEGRRGAGCAFFRFLGGGGRFASFEAEEVSVTLGLALLLRAVLVGWTIWLVDAVVRRELLSDIVRSL